MNQDKFWVLLPDGSLDNVIRIWDIKMAQTIKLLKGQTSWALADGLTSWAVLPNGSLANSSSNKIWNIESGKIKKTLEGHTGWVYSLASGSYDSTIRIWDLKSGETLQTLASHTFSIFSMAVLGDGLWFYMDEA